MKQLKPRTQEQIKADNAAFDKLSPARKRVAIAKDALSQLGIRLVAERGTYVQSEAFTTVDTPPNTQLQKLFGKMQECTVCAKGALFVCAIDRANKLKIENLELPRMLRGGSVATQDLENYLGRFFSVHQLDLIESAFEKIEMVENEFQTDDEADEVDEAVEFGELFYNELTSAKDDENRLRAILENIIVNKGTFVPSQHPELVTTTKWVTEGFRG